MTSVRDFVRSQFQSRLATKGDLLPGYSIVPWDIWRRQRSCRIWPFPPGSYIPRTEPDIQSRSSRWWSRNIFFHQSTGIVIPLCRPRGRGGSPINRTAQVVLTFLVAVLETTLKLVVNRSGGARGIASPKGRLTASPAVGGGGSWRLSRQHFGGGGGYLSGLDLPQ